MRIIHLHCNEITDETFVDYLHIPVVHYNRHLRAKQKKLIEAIVMSKFLSSEYGINSSAQFPFT